MALTRISNIDDWSAEIASAAEELMNASIVVYVPGSRGTYDPETDEVSGGTDDIPVLESKARIQHLRAPYESSGSYEWATKRRYRFQVPLQAGDPPIAKGMMVRVVDGGKDASLESLAFQVLSATNSSHAALRTIETFTEGGETS